MKRVESVVDQILIETAQKVQLNQQQKEKLSPFKNILLSLHQKNKEQIYDECVKFVGENVALKKYQVEPLLRILYERYFKHFQLLKQCACLEKERQSRVDAKLKKGQENFVFINVQMPYIAPPLAQAVQIPIKRGVQLDPLYLQ